MEPCSRKIYLHGSALDFISPFAWSNLSFMISKEGITSIYSLSGFSFFQWFSICEFRACPWCPGPVALFLRPRPFVRTVITLQPFLEKLLEVINSLIAQCLFVNLFLNFCSDGVWWNLLSWLPGPITTLSMIWVALPLSQGWP